MIARVFLRNTFAEIAQPVFQNAENLYFFFSVLYIVNPA